MLYSQIFYAIIHFDLTFTQRQRKFHASSELVLFVLHQIADLGLATSEAWSKLTKEESRRQSRLGKKSCLRGAGTLCYMAPEHLESIHTRSTEKSDVYSFAIVVWVILTGCEPYESESRFRNISFCGRTMLTQSFIYARESFSG